MTLTISTANFARAQTNSLDPRAVALAGLALMFAPLPATVIALATDPRTLNGADVWLKPTHFELSLIVHFATLALLVPLLSQSWRRSRLVGWSMPIAVFCAMLEIAYISLQAARGKASHFNFATPLDYGLYALMGLGAVLIVSGSAILGFGIWRSSGGDGTSQLRRGAALGLMLGSAATLVVAGYLSQRHGHLVGGPQTDALGLPFLGWSTKAGDLRVPHFFATHAMQALPIAGLLADRLGLKAAWLMPAAALAYFAGVLGVLGQALLGLPFIPL